MGSSDVKSNKQWALLLIAFSGFLYGCLGLFGTLFQRQGYSVSNMLFWRFALATLCILPICLNEQKLISKSLTSQNLLSSLIGAILYSITSASYFVASNAIGTGLSMVIFYTYPVMIFICLWLFLKQNIEIHSWISLVIVCIGLLLLNQTARSAVISYFGILSAIASALFYAIYILFNKKQTSQMPPGIATFILCLFSALYFFGASFLRDEFSVPHTLNDWLIALLLGFFATSLPIFLMLVGLKNVDAEKAAILSVLEPVVTVIIGVLLLSESLSFSQGLGVAVVLMGTLSSVLNVRTYANRILKT
jgi:drug/metabolite transporter (DMT)-like permease